MVGKAIIQNIIFLAKDSDLQRKVLFLKEYDVNVAHTHIALFKE
jgi:glucan phosphorylase